MMRCTETMGMRLLAVLTVAGALLGGAGAATATDGVLEINQACAATGCFSGDMTGFPVTITAPGSYALTGNLSVLDPNVSAIVVDAKGATIDLRGFEIAGPLSCSCCPTSCSGSGTGSGIAQGAVSFAGTGTTIRNGTVRGFAAGGILVNAVRMRVEDVQVTQTGGWGILVGGTSVVTGSSATLNLTDGFSANGNGVVFENCAARANGRDGFNGFTSVVRSSVSSNNGGAGVSGWSTAVINSQVVSNQGAGIDVSNAAVRANVVAGSNSVLATEPAIRCGASCTVESNQVQNSASATVDGIVCQGDCNVHSNSVAASNVGIVANDGSLVRGNTVVGGTMGLSASANAAYSQNVFQGNTTNVSGGVNTGGNLCNGSVCP